MGTYRSVTDYESEFELREALANGVVGFGDEDFVYEAGSRDGVGDHVEELDWLLTNVDQETSCVQSLQEELSRLQVLKSYQLVDAAKDANVDKITTMTARMFDVPMAGVSIIDLGKLCCFSTYGYDRDIEVPRKKGICSHTILSRTNTLVLPNASSDPRFADAPIVKLAGVRFYAGVALKAPEGYNLGTLCILDTEPRPRGLSATEESNLLDLADVLVQALVDRRQRLEVKETPVQLIANTAHDMLTPLSGLQLALSLLRDNDCSHLNKQHYELLATASSCTDILVRICKTSIDGLRQASDLGTLSNRKNVEQSTSMDELLKSLDVVMEPIPKRVPLIVTLDPSVPSTIPFDDIKLFRSALRLVTCAIEMTECGYVHLNIFFNTETHDVVFECSDTSRKGKGNQSYVTKSSPAIHIDSNFNQASVGAVVQSIGGRFGYCSTELGFTFWFSLPLQERDGMWFMESRVKVDHLLLNTKASEACIESKDTALHTLDETRLTSAEPMSTISSIPEPEASKDAPNVCRPALSVSHRTQVHQTATPVPTLSQVSLVSGSERTKSALVIDDSLVLRKSLSMALKKLGLDVTQAIDGHEGLICLKNQAFDVVLCDFLMPVMDGLDCVKQFRKWEKDNRPAYRQIIIGISAHADAATADQGREAGMDDFMAKPLGIKLLAELMESELVRTMGKLLDVSLGYGMEQDPKVSEDGEKVPMLSSISEGSQRVEDVARAVSLTNMKRPRANSFTHSASKRSCLMFCLAPPTSSFVIVQDCMMSRGWETTYVTCENEALQSLQRRNWDAVLIQDDTPASFIAKFRSWEQANRVNRQRNVFLVSSIAFGDNPRFIAQAPTGFNFVLGTLSIWDQMRHYLSRDLAQVDIIANNQQS